MTPKDLKARNYILKCRVFGFFQILYLKASHIFKFWGFGKAWDSELGYLLKGTTLQSSKGSAREPSSCFPLWCLCSSKLLPV